MSPVSSKLAAAAGLLAMIPSALAGFSSSSSSNIAVYWGQNSANGANTQQRLSYSITANNGIDVIPIAFMTGINTLSVNFASASNDCTTASNGLLICPEIEADIKTCQANGKTIMLSIGGATYSEGGFSSASAAQSAAKTVWDLFGSPTSTANRPFGTAVIDGFDLDLESSNSNFDSFAAEMRTLMATDTSKTYYLSAAPQCPYPDAAVGYVLSSSTKFDFVNVQFYNNYCGVNDYPTNFNFDTWDSWAKSSANPNAKVLLGVPASASAAGSGYVSSSQLATIISNVKQYSSFGGLMMWDMSQLYANSGYLAAAVSALGGSGGTTTTMVTSTKTSSPTSTKTTSTATPTGTGVGPYDQCGGTGYTGSTVCQSGYVCTEISSAWSQCDPA
ncbi:putative class III chitinase [Xylariaceae sp. FL0255]|nr:putative class III chitinase [Xylariaceae sp. FL0255]